jgi:hypothetical protein
MFGRRVDRRLLHNACQRAGRQALAINCLRFGKGRGNFAIFIAAHSGAALITRRIFELDTNFYWAAGTLVVDPLMWGFLPYYTAAVIALMTHLVCAMHFRRARKWHWPALMLSPFIAGAAIAGYSGALFPVTLPAEHEAYFSALASFLR